MKPFKKFFKFFGKVCQVRMTVGRNNYCWKFQVDVGNSNASFIGAGYIGGFTFYAAKNALGGKSNVILDELLYRHGALKNYVEAPFQIGFTKNANDVPWIRD